MSAVQRPNRALNNLLFRLGAHPRPASPRGTAYTGLFTSMFLHGGWMHLAGNMLFLYIFR